MGDCELASILQQVRIVRIKNLQAEIKFFLFDFASSSLKLVGYFYRESASNVYRN